MVIGVGVASLKRGLLIWGDCPCGRCGHTGYISISYKQMNDCLKNQNKKKTLGVGGVAFGRVEFLGPALILAQRNIFFFFSYD